MLKIVLLLLIGLITLVKSKEKGRFEGTRVKTVNSTTEIAVMTIKEDMNYVIFYHTSTRPCSECDKYAKSLIKLADKWKGVINVYHLDCGMIEKTDGSSRSSVQKCMREHDHELPKVDFYQPPVSKWDTMKNNMALAELQAYEGPPDLGFMEQHMYKIMTNYGKMFYTSQHLKAYLDEDYIGAKALVFIGDSGVSPIMKGLTAFFVDRMDFAFIHPELDEVIEQYGIEKTPSLVIVRKNTDTGKWHKPKHYKGKWEYLKIRNFCQRFALKNKNVKPEHSFFDKERMAIEDEKKMNPEEREAARKKRLAEKVFIYEIDGNNFSKEMRNQDDQIVLIHSSSQKSGDHHTWETVKRKLRGLVTIYEMNPKLPENTELIKTEFVGLKSPFIALYPPGSDLKKRSKNRRIFSKEAPFRKLAHFVALHTKDPSQNVGLETMRILVTNAVYSHKAAVILFHNNPNTLLSFRKVAGNKKYKQYMSFGSYKNPDKDVRDTLPTKKFPSINIFFSDFNKDHEVDINKYPIRIAGYTGSILVSEVEKFLNEFVDRQIVPKQRNSEATVEALTQPKQWESCNDNVFCIIVFVDEDKQNKIAYEEKKAREANGEKEDENQKYDDSKSHTGILRRIKGKYIGIEHNINAFYIDAACHHDMLPDFNLIPDELPRAVVVWHHRKQYAVMKEELSFENLDLFLQKIWRNSIEREEYKLGWKMHNRNCAQYKQQVLDWQKRDAKKALNNTETDEDLIKEVTEETKKRANSKKSKKQKKRDYWSE